MREMIGHHGDGPFLTIWGSSAWADLQLLWVITPHVGVGLFVVAGNSAEFRHAALASFW